MNALTPQPKATSHTKNAYLKLAHKALTWIFPRGQNDVINGCALMVSRQAFAAAGGWDEQYFMYSEETELCRSLAALGRRNYFVPDAQILHYGGQASLEHYAAQQVLVAESELAYLRRHGIAGQRRCQYTTDSNISDCRCISTWCYTVVHIRQKPFKKI